MRPATPRSCGEQRLKDRDRPVRLYPAATNGLPATVPPLRLEAELAQVAEAAIAVPVWRRRRVLAAAASHRALITDEPIAQSMRAATIEGMTEQPQQTLEQQLEEIGTQLAWVRDYL